MRRRERIDPLPANGRLLKRQCATSTSAARERSPAKSSPRSPSGSAKSWTGGVCCREPIAAVCDPCPPPRPRAPLFFYPRERDPPQASLLDGARIAFFPAAFPLSARACIYACLHSPRSSSQAPAFSSLTAACQTPSPCNQLVVTPMQPQPYQVPTTSVRDIAVPPYIFIAQHNTYIIHRPADRRSATA